MSVRTTLFVLLAALLLALIGAQWWLSQHQSAMLSGALARTAFSVSSDTVSVLIFGQHGEGGPLASEQVFDMALDQNGRDGAILLTGDGWQQRVAIPRQGLQAAVNDWHRRQYEFTAVIAVLALLGAAAMAYGFARPLQRLQQASQRVAGGELGVQVQAGASAPNELRATVEAFNTMSRELAKLEADNKALRAHEAANELADLARGLAHTLRNPLNTLGLTLEEMSRTDLSEDRRTQLSGLARRQIVQIDRWLRALLDVTQNDSQPLLRLDCVQLAQDVAQEFSDRHANIVVTASAPAPQLYGHAREIASLLHTLIGNAVDASPAGEPIQIQVDGSDDAVQFRIRDQGRGVSDAVRSRLFQPHVTDKSHGAGMGLFLSQRIARGRYRGDVQLHDGNDNADGKSPGTVAILSLHSRSPA
ncbi:HAMP domain-containing histidine kinase [Permianibacter sp. IMCC34836]|uniref:HAMP domain-containing sensor histidine kinase n=1 Tax=Permianibacter fluminis TaxID=2738515 RepID=UPI001553F751|nr:HAMP domain-containing sensor histidine kinase [Permianibacter fluminis]NQD37543.1 HAMP domain-containing histidine kinase [Permianibacter fluminis]